MRDGRIAAGVVTIRLGVYLSIDPGLSMGWALWGARGLITCGLGDPRLSSKHVVRASRAASPNADTVNDVWIEDQVIYPRSKVPPNDVLMLAKQAHRFAGRYDAVGVAVHFVEPSVWKGQVPKDIHHARVWAALSDEDRNLVDFELRGVAPSKRHNVLDALGLGQWVRTVGRAGQSDA